jgi:hypothetical protein
MNLYKNEKKNQVQARIDSAVLLYFIPTPNLFSKSHLPLSTHSKSEPEHPVDGLSYELLVSNVALKLHITSSKNYWRDSN